MDFSSALPTFIITLREGVEAALVIGIVFAYLKKAGQTHLKNWIYFGIGAGIAVSVMAGVAFEWVIKGLGEANQQYAGAIEPLMEGVFGLLAIGLLSWMLIWMARHAKGLKQEVESAVGSALKTDAQAGWGIFGLVFSACYVVFLVGVGSIYLQPKTWRFSWFRNSHKGTDLPQTSKR